jgi:hypothetical protein
MILTLHWCVTQASGFRRVRNRRVGASRRTSDPLGAGLYVFSGVRWLSPDDPCEAQLLSDGLSRLVSIFPHLGGAMQLERLKSILRRNRSEWDQSPGTQSRRRKRRALQMCDGGLPLACGALGSGSSSPCEHSDADHSSFALAPQPAPADRQATASMLRDWSLAGAGGHCLPAAAVEPHQPSPLAGRPAWHQRPARPFALAPCPSSPAARPPAPTTFAAACSAAHTPEQLPSAPLPLPEHVPAEEWVYAGWAIGEDCGGDGGLLDLPPAGDPGVAWATFDTLLPQILNQA